MSPSIVPAAPVQDRVARKFSSSPLVRRAGAILGLIMALGIGAAGWWLWGRPRDNTRSVAVASPPSSSVPAASRQVQSTKPGTMVQLDEQQQEAIGLRTATVSAGRSHDILTAPGRVAPDETQYAFITPRAAGVVRTVTAYVGQDVKAGDLLATIDSPEVGDARLELYTRLQALELAEAQAAWQETIFGNTLELIDRLQKGERPEKIHDAFADRAVGENRERLMTAYAQYRLALARIERNRELYAQKLITPKQFEQVNADYEVAQATYQSLMDQMGYESRLANTRAQQALKQAETAVRATRERLRILGVKPDGTEPEVARGKVVGVKPDGTLPDSGKGQPGAKAKPEAVLPPERGKEGVAVEPVGATPGAPTPKDPPVSTYSIWAPFDGTILDREIIVPGVAVDRTHRIFTMANLSTVYVEADVHEGDFDMLARSRGGTIRFRSPAYPDRVFEGEVIYTGDLVEETSRTIKLLARAKNPDRLLKPGMFVEVEILGPQTRPGMLLPASALLTHGSKTFVFVKTGPDQFAQREVDAEIIRGERVLVHSGVAAGDEVVIEGAFKLKAMTSHATSAGP